MNGAHEILQRDNDSELCAPLFTPHVLPFKKESGSSIAFRIIISD